MTAREVDGVAVVRDEPTVSQITARDGTPVVFQQTRTLTLADGAVVYGCAHCDYTSANVLSIRPHLGAHNRRSPVRKGSKAAQRAENVNELANGISLGDLLAKLSQIDHLVAERDDWKQRALAAERSLATLRKALTGAG